MSIKVVRGLVLVATIFSFAIGCAQIEARSDEVIKDTANLKNFCSIDSTPLKQIASRAQIKLSTISSGGSDVDRFGVFDKTGKCIFAFENFRIFSVEGTEVISDPDLFQLRDLTIPIEFIEVDGLRVRRFLRSDNLARSVVRNLRSTCRSQGLSDAMCTAHIEDWAAKNVALLRFDSQNGPVVTDIVRSKVYFKGEELNGELCEC